MGEHAETIIDGWSCVDMYPGTDWAIRTATKRGVEWEACAEGMSVQESGSGCMGYAGTYGITANVFMWLAQAVRL